VTAKFEKEYPGRGTIEWDEQKMGSAAHHNHYEHLPECQLQADNPYPPAAADNAVSVACNRRESCGGTRTILDPVSTERPITRQYKIARTGQGSGREGCLFGRLGEGRNREERRSDFKAQS
jgi:hypothetical protein